MPATQVRLDVAAFNDMTKFKESRKNSEKHSGAIVSTDSSDHDRRYERLQAVRASWCNRGAREHLDRSNVTVDLDGSDCIDIPAFYLALGRAVNGPNGYYGGCLDSLDDCLCGGFGLVPPFTLVIRNADLLRKNLDRLSWILWRKRREATLVGDSKMGDSELADLEVPLGDPPSNSPPYVDSILEVLAEHHVNVILS